MSVEPIKPPERVHVFPVTLAEGGKGFACEVIVGGGIHFDGVYDAREEAMQHMREWELPVFYGEPAMLD